MIFIHSRPGHREHRRRELSKMPRRARGARVGADFASVVPQLVLEGKFTIQNCRKLGTWKQISNHEYIYIYTHIHIGISQQQDWGSMMDWC